MKQRARLGKTNSIAEARHVKSDALRLLHLSPEGGRWQTYDPHPALRADPGSSPGQALPLLGGGLPPGERSRSGARPGGGASGTREP
jgi:hypothetical protein